MPDNRDAGIRNIIWQDEKKYLMKRVSFNLILNDVLKFGEFTLVSGKKSPYYIDLRQAISDPATMDLIAGCLARIIENEVGNGNFDKILGVPTAGIPFATLVCNKLAVPMIYSRKTKKDHGVGKQIEGRLEADDRVLMIDDLITTGKSVLQAAETVREHGGRVSELVVLLDREQGGLDNIRSHDIRPHILFNVSEAFKWLNEVQLLGDEHYRVIADYMRREAESGN